MESQITLYEYDELPYSNIKNKVIDAIKELNKRYSKNEYDGIFTLYRDKIKAKNYVGFGIFGDVQIQVLPKFCKTRDEKEHIEYLKLFLSMLNLAEGLKIKDTELARLSEKEIKHETGIHEIFIYFFARILLDEIKRGYHREYVEIESDERFLRGKLLLSKQIKRLPHQRHRFNILFHEFTEDNLLNQIFYYTTTISLENTGWRINKKLLSELMLIFADVSPIKITRNHLDKIRFTRLNDRFKIAFNLAKILLFGLSGFKDEVTGFFVDMNTLFERFVFKMIKRALPEFDVEYQRKLGELVTGSDDEDFSLKPTPDITILDNGEIKLIIDAKYKSVLDKNGKLSLPREDVYQAYVYSELGNCDVVLVYPKYGEFNKSLNVTNLKFFNRRKLIILPFDLDHLSNIQL